MKHVILALAVIGSLAGWASDADAVVCARGPYRAGCVGPNGAVGVRRGHVGGVVYRRGVVHHRRAVIRR